MQRTSFGLVPLLHKVIRTHTKITIRTCTTSAVKMNCWNCDRKHDSKLFCPSCKAVQCTECTKKTLNYFQLLDVEPSFKVNEPKLKTLYYELQNNLHPDRFVHKTMKEQDYSKSQSALVSVAYKTLVDPVQRGLHLLELNDHALESETVDNKDMSLLSHIFALNFQLDETDDFSELESLGLVISKDIQNDLEQMKAAFDDSNFVEAKEKLIQLKYRMNIKKKLEDKLLTLSL